MDYGQFVGIIIMLGVIGVAISMGLDCISKELKKLNDK